MDTSGETDFSQRPQIRLETALTPYELLSECRDEKMKGVVKTLLTCADSRSILISGENGTGKELVARALHEKGNRKDKPFCILDCTNMDEQLIRSELFGHERGSFTGAAAQKIGLLEDANGGTVFLDEIGEMPLELQPRLLRVLQDKEFKRVGGNSPIRSDFRLIAATNRDLPDMVRRGRFRQDLFFRINVFAIKVPPLRERKEDIIRLSNHFVDRFSEGKKILHPGAEALILTHTWPGNVRELLNAMERGVLFSNGEETILPEHLRLDAFDPNNPVESIYDLAKDDIVKLVDMLIERIMQAPAEQLKALMEKGGVLDYVEAQLIESILRFTGGNKLAASRIAGIGRQTVYNKIKRYGIPVDKT